jgi:hypothetical protein
MSTSNRVEMKSGPDGFQDGTWSVAGRWERTFLLAAGRRRILKVCPYPGLANTQPPRLGCSSTNICWRRRR